ncbi:formate C-acetyltransferase [Clostridium aminobutyricum]|uniref:Formate acetyltransferase n=1 Tax=Clostridium aminobutyricum TaxID=33953 RepID=A0A939DBE0_CLOAM|nr:formate C-acetyltransferase [Clostridium aminobutyricum]MBN7774188.1 formate C-acetyltransferase [Clostridium aminobutyricum]
MKEWTSFKNGNWNKTIDVRDFIQKNYTSYDGTEEFLAEPTLRTIRMRDHLEELLRVEQQNGGVYAIDTETVITSTSFKPGYLCKDDELIVGLQTDEPLKRACNPFGGMRMVHNACEEYGYQISDKIEQQFCQHKTHNDGVFDAYTADVIAARKAGIITGLPDAYGRGRIIGDYRRVALYGIDFLIERKRADKAGLGQQGMNGDNIRLAEEVAGQTKALEDMKTMASQYGYDISRPAETAQEAVQWLYFGYLAAIKEQNGAAMSLGRVSTFLDIYFERDLANGTLTEEQAQEIVDDFVLKLRAARHLRTPEYNELFGGDPMWITEVIGGIGEDGRSLVTKTCYRMLHTLYNLKPSAEPNLTVLWSQNLPQNWKNYIARVSIETDALQYENDDIMRPIYGDDYAIACCVSAMRVGKDMQFFGARANLAKLMLYAINGGRDELKKIQVAPKMPVWEEDYLDYDKLMERMDFYRPWLAKTYVDALNIIHAMHDKYAYEKSQMALHDTQVRRLMAFGIAGLSCLADSLSAVKYAKVKCIRDAQSGLVTNFIVEGDFPMFGNDDNRVDELACEQVEKFYQCLRAYPLYRDAVHTLSILTITSNVMYGKKTGNTPDGRLSGEPLAPGANPMSGREKNGALASLNSVAKLSYDICRDGISNTFSIVPDALGKTDEDRIHKLLALMTGYFSQGAHHLNVNVLNREILMEAYDHPEQYPNLTIRVSGYAVNFYKLSREQQREVIARTFHTVA